MKDDREDLRAKLLARREREGAREDAGFQLVNGPTAGRFIIPSIFCDGVTDLAPMLEQWFCEIAVDAMRRVRELAIAKENGG
jgi:hypothetical protein